MARPQGLCFWPWAFNTSDLKLALEWSRRQPIKPSYNHLTMTCWISDDSPFLSLLFLDASYLIGRNWDMPQSLFFVFPHAFPIICMEMIPTGWETQQVSACLHLLGMLCCMKIQVQPWSAQTSEYMSGYLQHLDYLFSHGVVSFLCPGHEKDPPHLRSRSKWLYQYPGVAKYFHGASSLEAP